MNPAGTQFNFKELNDFIRNRFERNWRDIAIVVVLAIVGGYISYANAQSIDPILFDKSTKNFWFEADITRVFSNMTSRESNHYRANVHPLFSLIAYPLASILIGGFKAEPAAAIKITIALVASLWLSTLFLLLRLIGCRQLDAILFSLVGLTSSAAIFWFAVPETYSFGSLSILLGLTFVALTQYYQFPSSWYIAINIMTMGITVTNWMVGILATLVNQTRRRSLWVVLQAFLCVIGLSFAQMLIFSRSRPPLATRTEMNYIFRPESGGPLQVIKAFIFHTVVMPAVTVVERWDQDAHRNWATLITQNSDPGSGTVWGMVAVVLWVGLLVLGVWGFLSTSQHPKLRTVLGFTLLGQLGLHIIYGEETFLYALHIAPLLLVLAAFSTLTKARLPVLCLVGLLILALSFNNTSQFAKTTELLYQQKVKVSVLRDYSSSSKTSIEEINYFT
jgi:hypothetical protein